MQSNLNGSFEAKIGDSDPLGTKWRTFDQLSRTLVIMVRYSNNNVKFAPMFIHQFSFLRPHFLAEAEKFNIEMTDPEEMETTADKLRYYRHKKGLLQKQPHRR